MILLLSFSVLRSLMDLKKYLYSQNRDGHDYKRHILQDLP
jgi:hypothetical protein